MIKSRNIAAPDGEIYATLDALETACIRAMANYTAALALEKSQRAARQKHKVAAGTMLIALKENSNHGEWMDFLARHGFDERRCREAMKDARDTNFGKEMHLLKRYHKDKAEGQFLEELNADRVAGLAGNDRAASTPGGDDDDDDDLPWAEWESPAYQRDRQPSSALDVTPSSGEPKTAESAVLNFSSSGVTLAKSGGAASEDFTSDRGLAGQPGEHVRLPDSPNSAPKPVQLTLGPLYEASMKAAAAGGELARMLSASGLPNGIALARDLRGVLDRVQRELERSAA